MSLFFDVQLIYFRIDRENKVKTKEPFHSTKEGYVLSHKKSSKALEKGGPRNKLAIITH